jgi:hypothetical protein
MSHLVNNYHPEYGLGLPNMTEPIVQRGQAPSRPRQDSSGNNLPRSAHISSDYMNGFDQQSSRSPPDGRMPTLSHTGKRRDSNRHTDATASTSKVMAEVPDEEQPPRLLYIQFHWDDKAITGMEIDMRGPGEPIWITLNRIARRNKREIDRITHYLRLTCPESGEELYQLPLDDNLLRRAWPKAVELIGSRQEVLAVVERDPDSESEPAT